MPSRNRSRTQPTALGKAVWFSIAGLVLVAAAGLAVILVQRSEPDPVEAQSAPAAQVPIEKGHIYSETADPKLDIAAALLKAQREHKRVILDFGGDWCGDCQVLDIYFHQAPNSDLLTKHFVLVHVWIGQMDANLDVPAKYGVPINKGVPALAVLAPDGSVLYSQKMGEFERMQQMQATSVTEFLEKWKG